MRLTKYTHACVRLERDGTNLVVDPGVLSEPAAYENASAILITHEHSDHVDVEKLPHVVEQNPGLRIYANAAVVAQLSALGDAVVTVSVGETFDAAGFTVQAVGGEHAETYDGLPGIGNIGYIVDEQVYHPGDALFVPPVPVPTLLLPVSAPWLKTAEMLDFVRAVKPQRAIPIHDAMLSEFGMRVTDNWVERAGQTSYERVPIDSAIQL